MTDSGANQEFTTGIILCLLPSPKSFPSLSSISQRLQPLQTNLPHNLFSVWVAYAVTLLIKTPIRGPRCIIMHVV